MKRSCLAVVLIALVTTGCEKDAKKAGPGADCEPILSILAKEMPAALRFLGASDDRELEAAEMITALDLANASLDRASSELARLAPADTVLAESVSGYRVVLDKLASMFAEQARILRAMTAPDPEWDRHLGELAESSRTIQERCTDSRPGCQEVAEAFADDLDGPGSRANRDRIVASAKFTDDELILAQQTFVASSKVLGARMTTIKLHEARLLEIQLELLSLSSEFSSAASQLDSQCAKRE